MAIKISNTTVINNSRQLENIAGGTLTGPLTFAAEQTWPIFNQNTIGNAATATTLATARTISITGDLSWTSPVFNGSENVTAVGTLTNTDVTAGSYTYANITVDVKGRITSATSATPPVLPTAVQSLTNKTINSGIYSGLVDVTGSVRSDIIVVPNLDIDCSLGNYYTKTIASNSTFTFSNIPSIKSYNFILEVTHTAGSIVWPASVTWPSSTAPFLKTNKTHLFMFVTSNGGTTWRGGSLIDY